MQVGAWLIYTIYHSLSPLPPPEHRQCVVKPGPRDSTGKHREDVPSPRIAAHHHTLIAAAVHVIVRRQLNIEARGIHRPVSHLPLI